MLQDDKLAEVVATHDKRVLLLTDRHIAALSVRGVPSVSTYRAQWLVLLRDVEFVRGASVCACLPCSKRPLPGHDELARSCW